MKNKSKGRSQNSKVQMRLCDVVQIVTPKKVVLNGLWFGSRRPRIVIVWVHGLGSSLFSKLEIIHLLAEGDTAVLTFNNRGHDIISTVHFAQKTRRRVLGGAAHEVFTECVDDIQGAINFAKSTGAKKIYMVGHSTGCQKSIYWASKKRDRRVKGIILLAPISDYSGAIHLEGKKKVARAAAAARALVRLGKKHELLPSNIWPGPIDAQRFLSLYTGEGPEEIFTYAQPEKNPRTLKTVRIPILVILAGSDEYGDRPADQIAALFTRQRGADTQIKIVKKAAHNFRDYEHKVSTLILHWIDKQE